MNSVNNLFHVEHLLPELRLSLLIGVV